jgi:uncharacterized membrane-anchored protein
MRPSHATLRKVPEITVDFWIVKVLTTAMGEATSDYMVHRIDPFVAVAFGGLGFAVAMALQLSVRRYIAWVYWLAVVMVAVFGTMIADATHIELGVPYAISSILFAVILAAVFVAWYRTEGTLSIHSILTLRRELFYWATVCATFALGTAVGDMTASTFHLGYLVSGILFAVVSPCRPLPTASPASTRWWPSGSPTSSPARWAPRSRTGWASPTPSAVSTGAEAR